jgi:hypothetical protein
VKGEFEIPLSGTALGTSNDENLRFADIEALDQPVLGNSNTWITVSLGSNLPVRGFVLTFP